MPSHRTFKPRDTFLFSFSTCSKCNEINYSCICDNCHREDFHEACQTIQDYRNCSYGVFFPGKRRTCPRACSAEGYEATSEGKAD